MDILTNNAGSTAQTIIMELNLDVINTIAIILIAIVGGIALDYNRTQQKLLEKKLDIKYKGLEYNYSHLKRTVLGLESELTDHKLEQYIKNDSFSGNIEGLRKPVDSLEKQVTSILKGLNIKTKKSSKK